MKKIALICSCLLVVFMSSCSASYERSTKPGEIVQITYDEYKEMKKTDDTYMVLITQTYCSHCKTYKKETLDVYLPEHGLTIYELNLTNEKNANKVFNELKEEFDGEFSGTPATLIFEDGENKVMHSGVLKEGELDDYVTSYQLDKK
ncbi:putative bacteriocin transport accessory protein [Breznakia sp. PF5-3]|uniref:hypothetical protein n=1 Tax=unclassified Breznakia TaxID=2623764 RepID=UPI002407268A|nr:MULTISPECIES: hypothetical protein [unclassified Breznakia]MDF9824010.1 putative bacteriocin transport accessory protein [Breznakia sp. PM6-1]MDF9834809.1 putative bacteriocin transport accessory protein [Breznakia sp. PF5-3]MDF9838128.1 putative bacteriocin transport accessory protein [Breznakia sp. PFB2-8]MDF9860114.1 putative bacteriocin transport accessory protein [Breznakia sp. PH5-24]